MSDDAEAILDVARRVKSAGGRALLVGGCVRDPLLGRTPKDFDIEVYGLDPGRLKAVLSEGFRLDLVGASFGVIKLHGHDIDVAIPRRETKLGLGHKAFEMEYDPSLSIEDAAARRDFTINAIYRDPLTDEVIDPWNGLRDLERRVLRHVSPHFTEDPLRVLRGMQFVARFGLKAWSGTVGLCRKMTPEGLARERQFDEWAKMLTKGVSISAGLNFLKRVEWVRYYPELAALINCRQDPEWHPEGDVWKHTCCCLDAFAEQRTGADDDLIVGLAVLCHDFGKPLTTFFDKRRRRIRSLGHDEKGVEPTLSFLKRLTSEERILREVPPLVQCHMRPFGMWKAKAGESAIRRLSAQVGGVDRLIRVAAADDAGRPPFPREPAALEWLASEAERLKVKDAAPKPLIQGRDLIALGMEPGVSFGRILKVCYEAQLDGKITTREQGLSAIRKICYNLNRFK